MKTPDQIFADSLYIRRHSRLSTQQLETIDAYLSELLVTDSDKVRKTHYFNDRYENIYVDRFECAELQQLLDESRQLAAELIDVNADELSVGFWFNLMQPGQITDWHTHDDLDELVSAVVYLKVPQNSGHLILKSQTRTISLESASGHYVFFDPSTPHAVAENLSAEHRLSIGMNFGLTSSKIRYQSAD